MHDSRPHCVCCHITPIYHITVLCSPKSRTFVMLFESIRILVSNFCRSDILPWPSSFRWQCDNVIRIIVWCKMNLIQVDLHGCLHSQYIQIGSPVHWQRNLSTKDDLTKCLQYIYVFILEVYYIVLRISLTMWIEIIMKLLNGAHMTHAYLSRQLF